MHRYESHLLQQNRFKTLVSQSEIETATFLKEIIDAQLGSLVKDLEVKCDTHQQLNVKLTEQASLLKTQLNAKEIENEKLVADKECYQAEV